MTRDPDRAAVFVDADNTLWDTDAVFAGAQVALLGAVESRIGIATAQTDRLLFVRAIDQALAERHHAGLRYPPRLLVRATELALRGAKANEAARAAWNGGEDYLLPDGDLTTIEEGFLVDLAKAPRIRNGVAEGLHTLKDLGALLLIVTEGAKVKVQRNADLLELTSFFDRIIEGRKTSDLYKRILSLIGPRARAFMIGDQLDRDIAPAAAAGLETIYFPGGFRPRWTPDEASVQPDHLISSFDQVPAIVFDAASGTAGARVRDI
ncbi:HAD family hydrolase [Mesorhizobium sp. ES1-6]|uniref:HAD family hydrolase n=1 Tax=Mesorhizobium sp. ES1-6 TaxID=2876626 RepID=UPI001CCA67C5|nr:HAD family hydrolase [Mesorhizobium sp. ES1-6]MBZ9803385.1 HAD family hydrolase [Mesorhizobium sp. ES1-6]